MNKSRHILIIGQDTRPCDPMSNYLAEASLKVTVTTEAKAVDHIEAAQPIDLLIVDHENFPPEKLAGTKIFNHLATRSAILVILDFPTDHSLTEYQNLGIRHFLFKPLHRAQCLGSVLAILHGHERDMAQAMVKAESTKENCRYIGESAASQQIRHEMTMLATSDLPILITGETGAGKDVIARELHRLGDRRDMPFMAVNCATLGSLAESELFGHTRGSFTGAVRSTQGYVGSAEGGVLFLDEIGDLNLEVQAKLLRFLDNQEYVRVGETTIRKGNVRILSATNLDLEALCEERRFRRDLLYRISGAKIVTRPLRERREDVSPLTSHFLDYFSDQLKRPYHIEPDALALLSSYDWPGNVRQLRQIIYQLCTRCQGQAVTADDVACALGLETRVSSVTVSYQESKRKVIHEFDRHYFSTLLHSTHGQVKQALSVSGMHKKNFYLKMGELGISIKDFRGMHA